jgi:glycosyltransferase involved in cell wall biosynthesis
VLVAPSPSHIDFITCLLAYYTLRPSERSACLMVLRRDPITIARRKHPLQGKAFAKLVALMMKRHLIYLAADSQLVLDTWLDLVPGSKGSIVGVTVLPDAPEGETDLTLVEPAGPLFTLAGEMRDDKGAEHYPLIADAVLAEFPDGAIAIQTSVTSPAGETATSILNDRFANEPRVQLISDYLSTDGYAQLMHATDIFVLPYDPVAYGGGSSGIINDALASGGLVVSTPLPWARSEFAGEWRVVWIEDPADEQQLKVALREAHDRSANKTGSRQETLERFATSWQDATTAAEKDAELRSR